MVFGVLGLCGQRVQPVAAQVLERENDRATARLPNMEANLVVERRGKLETAVIDHAQVTIKVLLFLARKIIFFFPIHSLMFTFLDTFKC